MSREFTPYDDVFPTEDIDIRIAMKNLANITTLISGIRSEIARIPKRDRSWHQTNLFDNLIKSNEYIHNINRDIDIQKEWHLLIKNLLDMINNKFETLALIDQSILTNLMSTILEDYASVNYEFRYFTFFNMNSYMYNLNRNQIKPASKIFRTGTLYPDKSDIVWKNLLQHGLGFESKWRLGIPRKRGKLLFRHELKQNTIGWSKKALIEALEQSEIFYEEIIPHEKEINYIDYWDYENYNDMIEDEPEMTNVIEKPKVITKKLIRYEHVYPNLLKLGMVYNTMEMISYLHISPTGETYDEMEVESNYSREPIKQFYLKLLPKYILEQLYHSVYKDWINLHKICTLKYMDIATLRRMIWTYYRPKLSYKQIIDFSAEDMCSIIEQVGVRKRVIKKVPEKSQELLLQPHGRTYMKYMLAPQYIEPKLGAESIPSAYRIYYQNCSDINKDKTDIIFDAIELGLSNYITRNMTKEDICNLIREYLEKLKIEL